MLSSVVIQGYMTGRQFPSKSTPIETSTADDSIIAAYGKNLPEVAKVFLYNLERLGRDEDELQLKTLQILYNSVAEALPPRTRLSLVRGVVHQIRSARTISLSQPSV